MIRVGHATISVCCELPYVSTGQSASEGVMQTQLGLGGLTPGVASACPLPARLRLSPVSTRKSERAPLSSWSIVCGAHGREPDAWWSILGSAPANAALGSAREPDGGFDCASSVVPSSARGGLGGAGRRMKADESGHIRGDECRRTFLSVVGPLAEKGETDVSSSVSTVTSTDRGVSGGSGKHRARFLLSSRSAVR